MGIRVSSSFKVIHLFFVKISFINKSLNDFRLGRCTNITYGLLMHLIAVPRTLGGDMASGMEFIYGIPDVGKD